MESNKLGKEPAFPTIVSFEGGQMQESYQVGNYEAHFNGINKRFYAACMAMQGLLSHSNHGDIESVAKLSFEVADELLKKENL